MVNHLLIRQNYDYPCGNQTCTIDISYEFQPANAIQSRQPLGLNGVRLSLGTQMAVTGRGGPPKSRILG